MQENFQHYIFQRAQLEVFFVSSLKEQGSMSEQLNGKKQKSKKKLKGLMRESPRAIRPMDIVVILPAVQQKKLSSSTANVSGYQIGVGLGLECRIPTETTDIEEGNTVIGFEVGGRQRYFHCPQNCREKGKNTTNHYVILTTKQPVYAVRSNINY